MKTIDLRTVRKISCGEPKAFAHKFDCHIIPEFKVDGHISCAKTPIIHFVMVAYMHVLAINHSLMYNEPILIMENDAAPTEWYRDIIDNIPEECDSLHIGYGWWYRIWKNKPYDDNFFKLTYGAGATHSYLLLNRLTKIKYKEMFEECIQHAIAIDSCLYRLASKVNILLSNKPMFYQGPMGTHAAYITSICLKEDVLNPEKNKIEEAWRKQYEPITGLQI